MAKFGSGRPRPLSRKQVVVAGNANNRTFSKGGKITKRKTSKKSK